MMFLRMVEFDVYHSVQNFGVVSLMAFEGPWKPECEFELEFEFDTPQLVDYSGLRT